MTDEQRRNREARRRRLERLRDGGPIMRSQSSDIYGRPTGPAWVLPDDRPDDEIVLPEEP